MKTKNKYILTLLATLSLSFCLTCCNTDSSFVGNKVSNDDLFAMDYSISNCQEDASMRLEAGDTLDVAIAHDTGTVDVTVGIDDTEPIYEGNGLSTISFTLNITESGFYQIHVTGHKAAGSVTFTKISPPTAINEAAKSDDNSQASDNSQSLDSTQTSDSTQVSNSSQTPEAYAAYQFALQQIAFEHVYPDGTDTGFDGASGFIEDNHFALCDVNGDGKDELIVQFVTAPMAGNIETVYSYHEEDNTLHKILAVFPAMTYYSNGLVKEDWSHGSALAGEEYWPYNLYQYNAETREYELIAEVNMWSKSVDTVDYKGDSFPTDIDAENAGTVFILTQDNTTVTLSKSDYEAWLSDVMGNAKEMQISYLALSEDNIQALQ